VAPKAVQIAVCTKNHTGFQLDAETDFGLGIGMEILAHDARIGDEFNPFDVMFFRHGVMLTANGNMTCFAFNNTGDVFLFGGGVIGVFDHSGHGMTTADRAVDFAFTVLGAGMKILHNEAASEAFPNGVRGSFDAIFHDNSPFFVSWNSFDGKSAIRYHTIGAEERKIKRGNGENEGKMGCRKRVYGIAVQISGAECGNGSGKGKNQPSLRR